MSKRRINKQQTRRIQNQQLERRLRAQQPLASTAIVDNELLGPEQAGLLITCFGTQVIIEAGDGRLFRCKLRQNLGSLVAGDQVIWCEGAEHQGVVVAVEPRKSVLGRPNKQGEIRPVAANIDQMLIVIAPQPPMVQSLLDSYLVAAESLQIKAVIVLNKVDLLSANEAQDFEKILNEYQKLDYVCLKTSSKITEGFTQLQEILRDKINVFVGQSGVGKSSLISSLLPKIDIAIGNISQATSFGKHTTCNSTLYHLPHSGNIIDSPGVREFSLWDMPSQQIAQGFKEIYPLVSQCKFRDCTHNHEPGCAVSQAVGKGIITLQRLKSYHKLCEKWQLR